MTRLRAWFLPLCLLALLAGCAAGPGHQVDTRAAAEANANLGIDFLRKGDNQRALSRLERALEYDDSNVTANWGLAVAYQRLGETRLARQYYETAIDIGARPAIVNAYAVFLCEQGDTRRAIDYFEQAADDPRNASPGDALANAGLCLERAGQNGRARAHYRNALAVDPDQPTALTQMAQLQFARDEFLSARAFIERADAVAQLTTELLLLAARTELALGDREAASVYLERHNLSQPSAALSLPQLEQSRP